MPDRNAIMDASHDSTAVRLPEQRLRSAQVPTASAVAMRSRVRIFEVVRAADPDAAEQAPRDHLVELVRFY